MLTASIQYCTTSVCPFPSLLFCSSTHRCLLSISLCGAHGAACQSPQVALSSQGCLCLLCGHLNIKRAHRSSHLRIICSPQQDLDCHMLLAPCALPHLQAQHSSCLYRHHRCGCKLLRLPMAEAFVMASFPASLPCCKQWLLLQLAWRAHATSRQTCIWKRHLMRL